MPSEIKIYKTNEFIRMNESGEIDFDKSVKIVQELAAAVSFRPNHNILIDLRKTTKLPDANMGMLMAVIMEFVKCTPPLFPEQNRECDAK